MTEREEELLNSRQVAVILDLSPDTVNEFARKNILPAFKKGKQWRFRKRDISIFYKKQSRDIRECLRHRGGVGIMGDIEAHESRLYSDFAPLYDKVFGKIFYSRLERVIEGLEIPCGAKVLEVGAGTGTSFPAYPTHCEVTGIDLAPDMLVRARQKIRENGWSHLKVMEMNALESRVSRKQL